MTDTDPVQLDLSTWPGAEQFRFFRGFERPHFATTSRIDVSRLMAQKDHLPIFRTCLWAIGAGLNSVPQLRLRFQGDQVVAYDKIDLSATIPVANGDFRFAYFLWQRDREAFDAHAAEEIAATRSDRPHDTKSNRPDLAFLSCLPWLDYTALDNAMPHADDCFPRVNWGKIVASATGHDMAMTLQVHHALVLGAHVGQFFGATQAAFDAL
jgi:chloramphenicol O-acetyltransferase type A